VADLNQGKFSNGKKSSSSPSSNQKPWRDTCVTSAAEVTVPGMANLLKMALDDGLSFPQLSR
jgi:hypothetical protein